LKEAGKVVFVPLNATLQYSNYERSDLIWRKTDGEK
jgi:hypothetical protein